MYETFMRSSTRISILALTCFVFVGCGAGSDRQATVPVTGKVSVDGAAVGGASITFHPAADGGRPAMAKTEADGTYSLTTYDEGDGAIAGKYNITISKMAVKAGIDVANLTMSGPDSGGDPAAYQKMMIGDNTEKVVEDTGSIPEKYKDPEKSGLERSVEASGGNEFNFDLK
jgi:hypothetical protein